MVNLKFDEDMKLTKIFSLLNASQFDAEDMNKTN